MVGIYREHTRDIPVLGGYDIVVAGGGPAGCAAALAAARHGADVLLVDKEGYLGGAAVSQLVCMVLSTNGMDFQGIWHDFMSAMKRLGGVDEDGIRICPVQIAFATDPEITKLAWEELLNEAGVKILYHSLIAGAIVEDVTVKGMLIETRAGRRAVLASRMIDCTGDGALSAWAGVPWEQGNGESKYAMACTKVLRIGNVDRPPGYPDEEDMKELEAALDAAIARGEYTTPVITNKKRILDYVRGWLWEMPRHRREMMLVTSRILQIDPLDPFDLTRAEQEGREQARQVADFYRRYVKGCENSHLVDTSSHIGIRSSRRVRGIARVTEEDARALRKYPDGVARGSWSIDIWPADSYVAPAVDCADPEVIERRAQIARGDYYDIRYSALVPEGVDNLLVAGRCISAEHRAQASLRIQQTCMSTGQAAGTAAALSLQEGCVPRELDAVKVISALEKERAGAKVPFRCIEEHLLALEKTCAGHRTDLQRGTS